MPTFADLNLLDCANCRLNVDTALPRIEAPVDCRYCGKRVAAYIFPALLRPAPAAPAVGATIIGAESSCFYHANKRASVACDVCGRFLCELCDVEIDGAHRCARCIEGASNEKTTIRAGQRYIYYDSIALAFAIAGLLFYFLSFVLAPVTLYFVIRYWNSPRSVIPRGRWRFWLAAGIAGAQLIAIAYFILTVTILA